MVGGDSEIELSRFQAAFLMADRLHDGQFRKGTEVRYISHLLAVAGIVMEAGGDEDETIAALLHDSAEDQGGEATLAEIRRCFGDRVADIVAECSDTFEEPKPPWKERKVTYIAHLSEASSSTILVSCADKLHNARAILADYRVHGEALWDRFKVGRDGTLWYYRELCRRYRELPASTGLVNELARTLERLERLTRLSEMSTTEKTNSA